LVWKGVHLDRRLTPVNGQVSGAAGVTEYLWHGLGFGGSCFPKDVAALRSFGRTVGEQTRILDAVLQINADQPIRMVSLLEKELSVSGKDIVVLGLAFKPGTDDLRESPALPLIAELQRKGARVIVHDPIAMPQAKKRSEFLKVTFAESWSAALENSDACCLVTAWPEYRAIQPAEFVRLMKRPLVIDGRGIFEPVSMAVSGVIWRGVGYTPECV
jgi:UDPglucose 6-dehydrogenase